MGIETVTARIDINALLARNPRKEPVARCKNPACRKRHRAQFTNGRNTCECGIPFEIDEVPATEPTTSKTAQRALEKTVRKILASSALEFGHIVCALRKELGFSQQTLAREMGIQRTYISAIENGRYPTSPRQRIKIAGALRVFS
jgi:DNA-binding XRE family transcriptional regulator